MVNLVSAETIIGESPELSMVVTTRGRGTQRPRARRPHRVRCALPEDAFRRLRLAGIRRRRRIRLRLQTSSVKPRYGPRAGRRISGVITPF
jgi:hypothetical protein